MHEKSNSFNIAQETFEKSFIKKAQAQGTIEYLIIIAIVVVIALVVVSILTGFLGTGTDVGDRSTKISNWTNSLSLTETSVNSDGNYLVRLVNNSSDPITISNVSVGDESANFSEDLMMRGGQNFVVPSTDKNCNEGENTVKTLRVTYFTKYGLEKTEVYPASTFFECSNYTVTLDADRCPAATYDGNAVVGVVRSGYTFFGDNSDKLTGTLATKYLSPDSNVFEAGYYDANNLSTIDSDLNADSILSGVTIFGVEGSASAGSSDPGYYALGSGQTTCYDESGTPRDCSGTGEDGDAYSAVPARVWDDEGCGTGTVLDESTGLCWQKADNGSNVLWQPALDYCNALNLGNYSSGWRLPTVLEIGMMYDYNAGARYGVFTGTGTSYWSSTSLPSYPSYAYYLDSYGTISYYSKVYDYYRARCVRFED